MSCTRGTILSLVVVAMLAAAGCGGSGRPATAPVRGQVTYQGRPVAGATVSFLCPGAPRPATGTTDAEGGYQLTTFEPNDGAVLGTHVVTVNVYWKEAEANMPKPEDRAAFNKWLQDAVTRTLEQRKAAENARPPIPSKYNERHTSNLRDEVVDGENVIDLELKD